VNLSIKDFQGTMISALGTLGKYALYAIATIVDTIIDLPETIANVFVDLINALLTSINAALGWLGVNIGMLEHVDFGFSEAAGIGDTIRGWGDDIEKAGQEAKAASERAAEAAVKAHSAFNKLGDSIEMSAEESEKLSKFYEQNKDALNAAGFIQGSDGRLQVDQNKEQDYGTLYNLLSQAGADKWGSVNSYSSNLMGYLRTVDADQLG